VDSRDSRFCERCGRPLSTHRRTDARFCGGGCRVAAWRHQRRRATDLLFRLEDDLDQALRLIGSEVVWRLTSPRL
jgi:hypothetical protein